MNWRMSHRARVALAALLLATAISGAAPSFAAFDPFLVDRARSEIEEGRVEVGFGIIESAIADPATAADIRADLLEQLARLHTGRGDHAAAGDAQARRGETIAALSGPATPELASVYGAAADAYGAAAVWEKALDFARKAAEVDTHYFDCGAAVLDADHRRIAVVLERLGRMSEADEERRLADAPLALRCADERAGVGKGPIVVKTDIGTADESKFARVKLFYATDRARSGSDRPNDFYSGDRGNGVDYGTVEVTIPRSHKPGAIEAPSLVKLEWTENPERHVVMTRIAVTGEDAMLADMKATLAERKSDEAFVFVHGFNVSFAKAARRAAQISYDINFDGIPVLYSWPSAANAFAYVRDEAVVRLSGRRLLGFLDDLVARSGANTISLIAHSMGNRALLDALELIAARRAGAGLTEPLFDQIIFAAPDEDAQLFARMLTEIRPLARRMTLYGSDKDLAISISNRVHGDLPRAGEGGDDIVVSKSIDSIDMTVLGDDVLAHSYFANTSSALTDVLQLFWRDAAPDQRCGMNRLEGKNGAFWRFDPNRCNGPVLLSALTLVKNEGKRALDRLNQYVAIPPRGPDEAARIEEWRNIRDALVTLTTLPQH